METAGELVSSSRPTLTRMAVGSVLPGSALLVGLALPKQTVRDTRALMLVLDHPDWWRLIQVAPVHEAAMRQVVAGLNQAVRAIATREQHAAQTAAQAASPAATMAPSPRDDLLNALEKLGHLHASGVLTDEEFTSKKAELLAQL